MKLEKVIWDRTHNRFLYPNMINGIAFDNGNVHYISTNEKPKLSHNDLFAEEVEFFSYFGLNDTSGNKIYADSSIIEFNIRNVGKQLPVIGYFKFDPILMRYYIRIVKDIGVEDRYYLGLQTIPFSVYSDFISNIKIIDTIQENKLGLVK